MTKTATAKLVAAPVYFDALLKKFEGCKATIAILGMGYVGFPLAIATHAKGFDVLAFDVDDKKIEMLNAGKSYLKGIANEAISDMVKAGRFHATADAAQLARADALIMCVPTPLNKYREPDMSFVVATTETIARHLRPGQLVCLESTTYPGTTTDLMKPMLEAGGLRAGEARARISSSPTAPSARTPATACSLPTPSPKWWGPTTINPARSPWRSMAMWSPKPSPSAAAPPPKR